MDMCGRKGRLPVVRGRSHGLKFHATMTCVAALLITWCSGEVKGQSSDRGDQRRGFESYQVVVEQNMFLRERGRRAEPPPREREPEERAPQPEPEVPEQWYVLRGLVFEGEEPLAFFENTREGGTRAYRAGDVMATGQIGAISVAGVEYEANGGRVQVGLGEDLRGVRSTAVAGAGTGAGSVPEGTTGGPETSGSGGDVLERMRRRSAMERGGR